MGVNQNINPEGVWNGTFGYAFWNGQEFLTLKSISTHDEIEYGDVPQPGNLRDGKKMLRVSGTGEIVALVTDKALVRELASMIDAGQQPEIEIEATNDDPASPHALYMGFSGCTIENLDYVVAESHAMVEETFPFSYYDRRFLN